MKSGGRVVVGQISFGRWECSHVGLCGLCGDPKWGDTMSNLVGVSLECMARLLVGGVSQSRCGVVCWLGYEVKMVVVRGKETFGEGGQF